MVFGVGAGAGADLEAQGLIVAGAGVGGTFELPVAQDTGRPSTGARNRGEGQSILGKFPYSGADIKLVVHLPQREGDDGSDQRVRELEAELQTVERDLARVTSASGQTLPAAEIRTQIRDINVEQEARHTELEQLAEIENPTEEQLDRMEELQTEITDNYTLLDNLESTWREANTAEESRPELERRLTTIRQQLEALNANQTGAAPIRTKTLAEISTLSYSIFREKAPVRPLGTVYPRSMTRGPRTIAGSMVFITFDKHVFSEFFEAANYRSTGVGDWDSFRYTSYITDQLPPMDLSITFANEYGNLSWMALIAVEFVSEGQTMSIEDLFVEGVAQFTARDIDLMRNVGNRSLLQFPGGARSVGQDLTGTNILNSDLGRRIRGRLQPWI